MVRIIQICIAKQFQSVYVMSYDAKLTSAGFVV